MTTQTPIENHFTVNAQIQKYTLSVWHKLMIKCHHKVILIRDLYFRHNDILSERFFLLLIESDSMLQGKELLLL